MGEFIRHECGLAMVRTLRPLTWYRDTYGDAAWGMRRLYLLLEKQHNRGQDGAGIALVKTNMLPGDRFMRRIRSAKRNALERVFDAMNGDLKSLDGKKARRATDLALKQRYECLGDVYLGHLRYGTHSGRSVSFCHPYLRKSNTASRNLAIAGNFNVTNSPELFERLAASGLNLVGDSDTQVILEQLGYCLDEEHDHLRSTMGPGSLHGLKGRELASAVSEEIDLGRVLRKAADGWDGGYVFGGLLGNGDCFICRDPAGIRPGFFYQSDEVFAAASERAALLNVFNAGMDEVQAIEPGEVIVVKHDGRVLRSPFTHPLPLRQCTFERIYFSRGNDPDIYVERKRLGHSLAARVDDVINGDLERTVFSYIPNTAETAFLGLVEGMDDIARARSLDEVWRRIEDGTITRGTLGELTAVRARSEKIAHKDQRLRTFITHDAARSHLVSHIYDITRGVVRADDTLVVLDDSIVRGTTLRESIITRLSRLNPKRIIVVSSAPPIMYPDCYGIDMSQLGRFIAFEAATSLLHERGEASLLEEVEARCRAQARWHPDRMVNHVRAIYDRFTLEELEGKISQLVYPKGLDWSGEVRVLYQPIEGLRAAMPAFTGDWYFTGDYPTPGGYQVLNTSYLRWRLADEGRAYEALSDEALLGLPEVLTIGEARA
ncbi:MAG: hypothetical protein KDA25_04260 [Phycisphaerales bacterium]|nr:hypothetical protein [Phycisphaerales bacterium]